jgi:hypothetical protein
LSWWRWCSRKEGGGGSGVEEDDEKEKGSWNPMIPILQQTIEISLLRDPRVIWLLIHKASVKFIVEKPAKRKSRLHEIPLSKKLSTVEICGYLETPKVSNKTR